MGKSVAKTRDSRFWNVCAGSIFAIALLSPLPSCLHFGKSHGPSNWMYQLQHPNLQAIAKSGFSIAVIDYSQDGSDARQFSSSGIKRLIEKEIIPLAYLSIGEAENYRFYWDELWVEKDDPSRLSANAPPWLGHSNPNWPDNYKIRYWDSEWRDHYLKPYLDRILESGFMGVYLDIVDAFEYWPRAEIYGENQETRLDTDPLDDEGEAASRMIALVLWIAEYCRSKSPHGERFWVLPQNGERIIKYDTNGDFLDTVSGIGVESVWYTKHHRLPPSLVKERLKFLDRFSRKGKVVLSVDYVDNANENSPKNRQRIEQYIFRCRSKGFLCYAAQMDQELDSVNRISGIQPRSRP